MLIIIEKSIVVLLDLLLLFIKRKILDQIFLSNINVIVFFKWHLNLANFAIILNWFYSTSTS